MKPLTIVVLCLCLVPFALCGGCLTLGLIVEAAKTPKQRAEQRERMEAESRAREAEIAADTKKSETGKKRFEAIEAKRPKPSQANYQRLQNGMTYNEVLAIVGEPTEEMSRSAIGENEAVMYRWSATGFGSMTTLFQNGRLVTKAQAGLK